MRKLSRIAGAASAGVLLGLAACDEPPRPASVSEARASELPPAQSGVASYYGPEFAGRETASGELHRPEDMTAASRTLPLGSVATVTNQQTGQSVSVEVNDRGPHVRGRILDVSEKAARELGMMRNGVAPVRVQPLPGSAPDPSGS